MKNFRNLREVAEKIVKISKFMRDEGMECIWEGDFFTITNEDDEPYCDWEVKVTSEYVELDGRPFDINSAKDDVVNTLVEDIIQEFGEDYFNGAPIWEETLELEVGA